MAKKPTQPKTMFDIPDKPMKPKISYEAFDGVIFRTAEECAEYETHCRAIAKIIDKMPRFTFTDEFISGRCFYLHDRQSFIDTRSEFFMYLDSQYPKPEIRLQIGEPCWVMSPAKYLEIIVSLHDGPLLLAWYYIGCVDDYARQWSNPYIASNPPEHRGQINP